MNSTNYSQIYTKLTKGLSPKTKDIFDRRFGVKTGEIETLESIGDSMGITRERVRQIEEVGFNFVRKNNQPALDALFAELTSYFKGNGGFKNEDEVLAELGGKKNKPYVLFLLTLGDQFARVCEKKDHTNFWVSSQTSGQQVKETLASLVSDIEKHGSLLTKEELFDKVAQKHNLDQASFASYLGVSKKIQTNKEGKFGLIDWPEIKPRGVRDKAFLVFKKHQKPLHFTEITSLIDTLDVNQANKKTHPQTVHNELIKDPRFVLVGRGMYALNEWGYEPGTIKDIITKVLAKKQEPIHKDDIVKEVLQQRLVAKNTVLMNLNNKKYFQKDNDRYYLRETQVV
jgi:DNA-directed RNA polymerase delta subunit/DNA-binding transcriptional regulator YiaG